MNATLTIRRSRRIPLLGVLAVVAALAIPAAASAAKTQTSVTITPGSGAFFGKVTSEKSACERGRTVELFHVEQNGDRMLGTFVTPDKGKAGPWAVAVDPNLRGLFYADVARNPRCADARSNVIPQLQLPGLPFKN
jgi:hypothetical protein